MTNNNAYDGYTPSKAAEKSTRPIKDLDLPGGKNSQWENLARANAEHEREYYSLRAIFKRWAPSGPIRWEPVFYTVVLILVLVVFKFVT